MANTAPQAASAVTALVFRRGKPGHEAAFEQIFEAMIVTARPFPGYLGDRMVHPDAKSDDEKRNLYHAVFTLDTPTHLQAWQSSPDRAGCLQAMAPNTLSNTQLSEVGRLDNFLHHVFAFPDCCVFAGQLAAAATRDTNHDACGVTHELVGGYAPDNLALVFSFLFPKPATAS